jgi:hypothetical protein
MSRPTRFRCEGFLSICEAHLKADRQQAAAHFRRHVLAEDLR